MKINQEIIEAKYSILDLTQEEYRLLQKGLEAIVETIYRRGLEMRSPQDRNPDLIAADKLRKILL